ncbi:hypothetical protein SO694_00020494 [Aureococcus anophagefferens]|uniref:J domain-containing protein n=1 Tax=Aureococcus anophagefferens TaxID=44056 RepID=A0ABR1FU50_AURAN
MKPSNESKGGLRGARAASGEEPEDSAASRRDSKTRRDAEARDAAAAHDDCGTLKSLLAGLGSRRPLGDGSSSPLVDVAAVAAAARAVAARAPCAALGGLADARALPPARARGALEALDDAERPRRGRRRRRLRRAPGGAPPNRAALFALKCRAGLSLAADDGAAASARPPPRARRHAAAAAAAEARGAPPPAPARPAAALARFETKLEAAAEGALRLGDLPLPRRSGSVSGASRADPVDDRKRAVRAALLRWHPDKFDLSKFHPDDRDAVSDAVAEVTRRIVKEKKFLA